MAATAPPMSAMRAISAVASAFSSSTLRAISVLPSKMSPYSSRSVSKATICCRRNDHCWSHGRGRPSASFHAGNCTERARAFLLITTASISSRMR